MNPYEIAIVCPACRPMFGPILDRGRVYVFARVYLCEMHRKIWDAADAIAHGEGACPWSPAPCRTICSAGGI